MPQGRPPISRRLARSVLFDALIPGAGQDDFLLDDNARAEVADRVVDAAATVKRTNTREHGETIVLTFVVPPDEDGKLGDA